MNSKRLPEGQVEGYVVLLKGGDREARDRLIESHVPLALAVAKNYGVKFPHLKKELVAVALENLAEKVEKIRLGESLTRDNNIGAFLNKTTCLALRHFIKKHQSRLRRDLAFEDRLREAPPRPRLVFNPALENLILDEIMSSPLFTDAEKLLIRLRIAGMTDEEVASQLGVSQQRVCLVRNNLRKRLEAFI